MGLILTKSSTTATTDAVNHIRSASVFFAVLLSSCVAGDPQYIQDIQTEYQIEKRDCELTGGQLQIPRGRVHNAPPTVWEMKGAWCKYE